MFSVGGGGPSSCKVLLVSFDEGDTWLRVTKAWSHIKRNSIQLNFKPADLPWQQLLKDGNPDTFRCIDDNDQPHLFVVKARQHLLGVNTKVHSDTTELEFGGFWTK